MKILYQEYNVMFREVVFLNSLEKRLFVDNAAFDYFSA